MARQVSMYMAQKYTKMPASRIGKLVGNRDHSTVIHSCSKIEDRLKVDKGLQLTKGPLTRIGFPTPFKEIGLPHQGFQFWSQGRGYGDNPLLGSLVNSQHLKIQIDIRNLES